MASPGKQTSDPQTDLEAEGKLVDPGGESSDLSVRQNTGVVGVDFVKHIWDVQLLLGAHQEVKVGKGELHVLRVTNAVRRGFVELSGKSEESSSARLKKSFFQKQTVTGKVKLLLKTAMPLF